MSSQKDLNARSPGSGGSGRVSLFLVNSLGIGGSERKIVRIANELASRGCGVLIAYLNPPDQLRSELSPKVRVIELNRQGRLSIDAVRQLQRIIEQFSIDNIVSVSLYPALYAGILRLGGACIEWTALINTTDFRTAKEQLQMLLYAPLLSKAGTYVFGSHYQKRLWNKRYCLSEKKSICIHNGIDTGVFDPEAVRAAVAELRESLNISEGAAVIGTVGQMRPEKRQDLILQAAAAVRNDFPQLVLIIVGDGIQREYLEKYAEQLGIQSMTRFVGAQMDVRPALSIMDIFILSSTSVETFSNAALEAMSMGKALILSDISGAREMVNDGDNGYIVSPGDAGDLIQRLTELLNDPGTIASMGKVSRQRTELEFSFSRMVDEYETLLDPGR